MKSERYPAISAICTILKTLGAIVIFVGIAMTLYGVTEVTRPEDDADNKLGWMIIAISLGSGVFGALLFFAVAETMSLQVDIESNTRQTKEQLKKIAETLSNVSEKMDHGTEKSKSASDDI